MKNAHERFGWLEFDKPLKDTRTRIRVALDRFIGESFEGKGTPGVAHVISVFGSDVDIGSIWAAIAGQELLTVSGPGIEQRRVSLGKDPRVFRGTIAVAGRSRSIRHLMALSAQMADDTDVGRIIVSECDPEFVLYRISQRLGLPVHPSWAKWFWAMLKQHKRTKPLDGLGYQPIAIAGTKQEFLEWIGDAVKEKVIEIPDENDSIRWKPFRVPQLACSHHQRGDSARLGRPAGSSTQTPTSSLH
jgi:hypothetical protein